MNEQTLQVWNVTEQLLSSRVIKLYGEVNNHLAHEVTSLLDVLSNDDPTAVIKLEICTPGGSVLDGLAIIDKIREIPNPVVAFNTGLSASMGTAICAACDFAFGSENAQFMIHEMSSGAQGKFREMKNQIQFDEDLNKRLMTIIANKCHKTYDELMNSATYDLWMSAVEAKEFGLIDEITPAAAKNNKSLKEFTKSILKNKKRY